MDETVLPDSGRVDIGKVAPVTYAGGQYWSLGEHLGEMGFSRKG